MNDLLQTLLEVSQIPLYTGNSFEVSMFGQDVSPESIEANVMEKARIYCNSYSFPMAKLKYSERHKLTREFYVEGVDLAGLITFTWSEDQYWKLWNYHKNWFKCFYDRSKDVFVSGPKGKKRTATALIHDPYAVPSKDMLNERYNLHKLEFIGLQPVDFFALDAGWSSDANNSKAKSITYNVDKIKYTYLKEVDDSNFSGKQVTNTFTGREDL